MYLTKKNHSFEIESAQIVVYKDKHFNTNRCYDFFEKRASFFKKVVLFAYENWAMDNYKVYTINILKYL